MDLSKIIDNPATPKVLIGLGGFAAGMVAGYFIPRKAKYEVYKVTDEDVPLEEVPQPPFDMGTVAAEHPTYKPVEEVQTPLTVIQTETVVVEKPAETVVEVVTDKRFGENDGWSYDEERKLRSKDVPYVLHMDEFLADEMDLRQITLTYYAGDDIMVDEDESPLYNYSTIVGELKFGHGSNSPSTFYVRNEKRKCEYEIIRDPGKYSEEILGLEIEDNDRAKNLAHSRVPRMPRE